MILRKVLVDSSKRLGVMSAEMIGSNPQYFNQAIDLMLDDESSMSSRAGRVVVLCIERFPFLVQPYLVALSSKLNKNMIDATKRSILKIFTLQEFINSEEVCENLLSNCFDFVEDNKESIAVRVFSMEVLYKISNTYPDIKNELALIIQEQMKTGSAGVRSVGNKLTKRLKRELAKE